MNKRNVLSPDIIPPLLEWYRSHRKPLPWRENKDPYRIWLSEIMLQQTRIEAVIPYYHRFLAEAPTVADLAALDDERLMKLWEGLGYYSRARNLKKAAITVVTDHGGSLPPDFTALRALSGVGDYTAGAIASIAFGLPEPAVDGNVLRVIMRLTGREDDIATSATKKTVTEWLRAIYPNGDEAGELTEGLMELGEHICLPNGVPKCESCPWRDRCVANRENRQAELPKKSPKKEKRQEEHTVLLLIADGKIALSRRAETGLLAGMWEFPNLSGHRTSREVESFLREQGQHPLSVTDSIPTTHIFTHVVWSMKGVIATFSAPFGEFFWASPEELTHHVAIPTAYRAYVKEFFALTQ